MSTSISSIVDVPKEQPAGPLLNIEQPQPKLELPPAIITQNSNVNKMEISQSAPIVAQNPPPQPPPPQLNINTVSNPEPSPNSNPLQQILNNNTSSTKLPNLNMSQFTDPLEHTLASLEQPQLSMTKSQDLNSMLMDIQKQQQQQQQLQINLLNQIPVSHPSNPAGFGTDFNGVNGLMNILGIQSEPANMQLLSQQMKGAAGRFPDMWNVTNPALPMNPMAPRVNNPPNWDPQQQQQQQQQPPPTMKPQDKIILTPKPIQELLAVNDKSKLPDVRHNTAFGQTFKYEQNPNLKNANSWSQLASHDPMNTSNKSKLPSDTFNEFRTKAKEQQQRQKQEAEKIKRQKEQELKRQQESLQKQTKIEDGNNGQR